MSKKTCGECKHYDMHGGCNKIPNTLWIHSTNIACIKFEAKNPTNGDCIRQGGDDALIDFADGIRRRMCHYCVYAKDKSCVDKTGDCWEGIRAWLNAPADCVGKDTDVPAEDALKAEIARYRRALYNLKEDCTRRKNFAVSDEEKLFLYETISHIEAELDFNTDTGKGGEDEPR